MKSKPMSEYAYELIMSAYYHLPKKIFWEELYKTIEIIKEVFEKDETIRHSKKRNQ